MDAKTQNFEMLVTQIYKEDKHFPQILNQLKKARELMSENINSFRKMNANQQYEYCNIIVAIALDTSNSNLNKTRFMSPRKPSSQYAFSLDNPAK